MLLCPQCEAELEPTETGCQSCDWVLEHLAGIPVLLSAGDKSSPLFSRYSEMYESVASAELAKPVNDDRYVETMAKKFADFLGDVTGQHVCDLGAGKGFLIRHILPKGPKSITAVDISVNYLRTFAFSDKVKRIIANAENLPFADEFDLLVTTDVLEHVLNLGNFLFCVNRALKRGGVLAVRVPLEENQLMYSKFWGSPYPFTHLRTFNKSLLTLTLEQAGFDIVGCTYDGFQPAYPRPFFAKTALGRWAFRRLVTEQYPDYWDVTAIDSRLGNLLMRPIEIAVLARKREVLPRYDKTNSVCKTPDVILPFTGSS